MKVEGDIYDDTLQLHVIDLILKDVGTSGYTEYDWGTTLAEYFEENEDKWPVMFFSIHSHHNMGVSPSGVDDKHLYDENIEEDKKMSVERHIGDSGNKSLDLMKKLNDYLGY
jgi:hypothetical protein